MIVDGLLAFEAMGTSLAFPLETEGIHSFLPGGPCCHRARCQAVRGPARVDTVGDMLGSALQMLLGIVWTLRAATEIMFFLLFCGLEFTELGLGDQFCTCPGKEPCSPWEKSFQNPELLTNERRQFCFSLPVGLPLLPSCLTALAQTLGRTLERMARGHLLASFLSASESLYFLSIRCDEKLRVFVHELYEVDELCSVPSS